MKSKIKKTLLISGIAILGLLGIKYSYNGTSTNDEDAAQKIEYAYTALARVNQELASDSLNPEERHELILTRNEIQREINSYSKNKTARTNNNVDISALNARLEFSQNMLNRIENELKSDSLNPEERHELVLTRINIQREIQELRQQISGATKTMPIIAPSHEK